MSDNLIATAGCWGDGQGQEPSSVKCTPPRPVSVLVAQGRGKYSYAFADKYQGNHYAFWQKMEGY